MHRPPADALDERRALDGVRGDGRAGRRRRRRRTASRSGGVLLLALGLRLGVGLGTAGVDLGDGDVAAPAAQRGGEGVLDLELEAGRQPAGVERRIERVVELAAGGDAALDLLLLQPACDSTLQLDWCIVLIEKVTRSNS